MSFKLTKKEILKEVVKSGKDPSYFLKTYARISHPMHGLILFNTFDYQDELLNDFNVYRFNVINKGRQLGISTLTAGYIVWMMLFHRDKSILVMATKFETAGNLVRKVKSIMKNFQTGFVASITTDNRTSFELSNGSTIKAASLLAMLVVLKRCHYWCLTRLHISTGLKICGPVFTLRFRLVVAV